MRWSQDKSIGEWLLPNRLDAGSDLVKTVEADDKEKISILKRIREASVPAVSNLMKLIEQLDQADEAQQVAS